MTINPLKLCQIEIRVRNLETSIRFYEHVLGWKAAPADLHDYVVLHVPRDCPFGISLVPTANESLSGSNLVLYFEVDEPKAVLSRVEDYGGKLVFGPATMGGYGRIYQFADPDGQRFGLYTKPKRDETLPGRL